MKANLDGTYVSKKGNVVFRYKVTGTTEELAAFAKAQGANHRTNEAGESLWFSTRYAGKSCNLMINREGSKVFPDMSELQAAESIAKQFAIVGGEIAKQAASKFLGGSAPVAANAPVETEVSTGLDK